MKNKFKVKYDLFSILFIVITLCFVLKTGAIYSPDSLGYINMDIYRSSGYPLFIAFHKLFFGSFFIFFLLLSQFVINIYGIFFITKNISNCLSLSKWNSNFLLILLSIPFFYEIKVINNILSEALAYPLFLLITGNIFNFITFKNFKNIYFSIILLVILIQVRGQFLFVVPVIILAILISKNNNNYTKKHWIVIAFAVSIPFISIGTDITFHKIAHNKAITTPWTGIQISALPLFVSKPKDYLAFKSKLQQDYFKFLYSNLEKKKVLSSQVPEYPLSKIDFYYANYVEIANNTIGNSGEVFFKNKYAPDDLVVANDKMAASITLSLIKNNFIDWSKLYFQNIAKGIGSAIYLILNLFLLLFSMLKILKDNDLIAKFIFIGTLLIIGNITLVALAEPTTSRYCFYTNWILISIVMVLFQKTFYKKTDE
ncbi:hypothetical protein [Flavobacterium sp.]|uniref:hypothetical protein n=1 Tax=Flavobacterium sp. TaxID=239 RepID=UPI0033426193